MDFSGIKAITIPEGSVKKISANGVTLWEKVSYVNQIPLSIGSDGKPYNNGQGWKADTRLNSTGSEVTSEGVSVTGFIPAKRGDTIYFKNVKTATSVGSKAEFTYLALYNKSFTHTSSRKFNTLQQSAIAYLISDVTVDASGYITSLKVKDTYNEHLTDSGGYFRVSAEGLNSDSIITVNQPIQ